MCKIKINLNIMLLKIERIVISTVKKCVTGYSTRQEISLCRKEIVEEDIRCPQICFFFSLISFRLYQSVE